jgi:hypothetical protein
MRAGPSSNRPRFPCQGDESSLDKKRGAPGSAEVGDGMQSLTDKEGAWMGSCAGMGAWGRGRVGAPDEKNGDER